MTDDPGKQLIRFHFDEYVAEAAGTAFNLFIGLNAMFFDFGAGLWPERHIPSHSIRLLITGLIYAGSGSLFAISPPGRLSGGHINPSVTIAFLARHKMHWHDAVGYVVGQFVGAIVAALVTIRLWGNRAALANFGMTFPRDGFSTGTAFGAEVVMTGLLVLAIFFFLSNSRLMRWTPLMTWILVAVEVWLGAPISGTSLNPARSFGPALVGNIWRAQWIYFAAPIAGALAAVYLFRLIASQRKVLTAKMFHSAYYRSIFQNTFVPHLPARGTRWRPGEI
jgi:aquaporin Z